MSTRKSPAESATLYAIGTKKKGLDGNQWIITETKNGVKRWKMHRNQTYRNERKVEKKKKESSDEEEKMPKKAKRPVKSAEKFKRYLTHDNGARNLSVHVSKSAVSVFKCDMQNEEEECVEKELILTFKKPLKVWIGIEPSVPSWNGNSIVLQISRYEYVFIGDEVYKFQLAEKDEKVKDYFSPVGNSDVPYPYLITNKNVYFMIDNCYASREYYDKEDLYFNEPYEKHYTRDKKDYQTHKLKNKKILQERLI